MHHKITVDRGKELLAEFNSMIPNDNGIPCNSISVRNPQANEFAERVHQTIGNFIRALTIKQMDLDNDNPWEEILSCTMFAIRSTVHTTTKHASSQRVFGKDAILNIITYNHKQALINKGNQKKIVIHNLMCTSLDTKSCLRRRGKQSSIKTQILVLTP